MENKNLLKQNRRPTKAGQLAAILIRHSNVLHNRINEKIITNISLFGGPFVLKLKQPRCFGLVAKEVTRRNTSLLAKVCS